MRKKTSWNHLKETLSRITENVAAVLYNIGENSIFFLTQSQIYVTI